MQTSAYDDDERGRLLHLPEIAQRTGMPPESVRTRRHRGQMPCVWKLGRRLVAYERDLQEWMDQQQAATTKTRE